MKDAVLCTVKKYTCFGKSFPRNRGEVTSISTFSVLVLRIMWKCVLECPDHFGITLKITPGKSETDVPSPLFRGNGSPNSVFFFRFFFF